MLLQYYFSSYEIPRYYILPQRQTGEQKCRSAHWCRVFDFDEELPIRCRVVVVVGISIAGMNFTRGNPCYCPPIWVRILTYLFLSIFSRCQSNYGNDLVHKNGTRASHWVALCQLSYLLYDKSQNLFEFSAEEVHFGTHFSELETILP